MNNKRSVSRFFVYATMMAIAILLVSCTKSSGQATDVLQEPQTPAQGADGDASAPQPAETVPAPQAPPQEEPSAVKIASPSSAEPKPAESSATTDATNTTNATVKLETEARKKLEAASQQSSSQQRTNSTDVVGFGSLSILSSPSRATITIDGQEKSPNGFWYGKSPVNIKTLPAGNRVVKLTANGYQDSVTTVYIAPGRNKVLDVTLTPK